LLTCAAWGVLAILLVAHLPPFLCMGLDSDTSLFDLLARNVLRGKVLYRDTLDPNLPGMVWLHVAARSLLGWSSEALRAADFTVVAIITWLLTRWLPPHVSKSTSVALAIILLAFYLSTTEWSHCQRDTWMLLPAVLALGLRRRQIARLSCAATSNLSLAAGAFTEGALWGAAFWIKPYVAVPAVVCWLVGTVYVWRNFRPPLGKVAVDGVAFLTGGAVIGLVGIGFLVQTGAWKAFTEVMFEWNREYVSFDVYGGARWFSLVTLCFHMFPWVIVHLLAIPAALEGIWQSAKRSADAAESPATPEAVAFPLLAGFYLGWLGQAVFLQHAFEYIHVPPIFLGWTVIACAGFKNGPIASASSAFSRRLAYACAAACLIITYPWLFVQRGAVWSKCFTEAGSAELRDRLTLLGRMNWSEFERVADFLRSQRVQDKELTTFSLPTEPLYLDLDLEPSTRYVILQDLLVIFGRHRAEIHAALAESRQRFVVCDLTRFGMEPIRKYLQPRAGDPPAGPYPWSEKIAFRSGRYVLFQLAGSEMASWLDFHFRL
jgi:hypothetical protein